MKAIKTMKTILIIEGYLASGKSTFALQLAEALKIPYFIKDTFKIALCKNVTVRDRRESSRFSAVTFDAMMYAAKRLCEAGYPFLIEGNFAPAGVKSEDEAGVIRKIIRRYGYTPLTFKFSGDTRVLHRRFIERDRLPERGRVNAMGFEPSYAEFDRWCRDLDAFDVGGRVIQIDTTDFSRVDFKAYIEAARLFMNSEDGARLCEA